jgi:thioesterase domain-containing protein
MWSSLLGLDKVGIRDNFFEIGGHSLMAARLVFQIHQMFGCHLSVATIFQHPTVEQFAELIQQQVDTPLSPLLPIQTDGSLPPLFCVHPIGGYVLCYRELAQELAPKQPVFGLQVVGLEDSRPLADSIEAMAAEYLAAIQQFYPDGPYLLNGWSFGGVVAFEMAQQLWRQNRSVAALILIDSWAPGAARQPAAHDEVVLISEFVRDLEGRIGKPLDISANLLRKLPFDDQFEYLSSRLQHSYGQPEAVEAQVLRRAFEVYRANYQALLRYQPERSAVPLTLIRAIEGLGQPGLATTLGWEHLVVQPVTLKTAPGTHYSMLVRPNVERLAQQIHQIIQHALHPVQRADIT